MNPGELGVLGDLSKFFDVLGESLSRERPFLQCMFIFQFAFTVTSCLCSLCGLLFKRIDPQCF